MAGSRPAALSPAARADFDATVAALAQERALRRALAQDEFALFLQPIVRLATGRLAGFEALIRWHDPERGLVPPAAFIPAAEASGLIVAITAWVIGEIGRIVPPILQAACRPPPPSKPPCSSASTSPPRTSPGRTFRA